MNDFSHEFPILKKCTYLNTAASGLLASSIAEWRREHDAQFVDNGSVFREGHKTHIEDVRTTVANFCGAQRHETSLVPNFSYGFNALLEGLPKGQKVLLLKNDYPSINWPVEQRDFKVCYANIDAHLEANISEAITEHQPEIFAFSIVQYINGVKIDLDFISKLKEKHPNLLIIADGTQFIGTQPFDISNSGIDVLGASTYKWLSAGYGNGLFIVRELAQERIFPNTIGFNSAETFDSDPEETLFIKHFEPGHHDTLNFGSLKKAIDLLESIGIDKISEKLETLSVLAKERFATLNLLEETVLKRKHHSTIFNLKGDKNIFKKLRAAGIVCSPRGGGIRVSFHFYNTPDDLERLVSILKE